MNIEDARILIKSSTTPGAIPTIPASNDHLDGTWSVTDIYKQELFINYADSKMFTRTDAGILQIPFIKDIQANVYNTGSATGTDTYALTLTPALTAYTTGNIFAVKFANANTGASTINVNTLGAKNIYLNGAAIAAGTLTAGVTYLLAYNGTQFDLIGVGYTGTADRITITGKQINISSTFEGLLLKKDGSVALTADWNAGSHKITANSFLAKSPTLGIGYKDGAGGEVTQVTSKSTGVTLNTVCGKITTHNAALANATSVAFTVTNSTVAATDTIILNIASGATSVGYLYWIDDVSAGSFRIGLRNISGGSLSESIVFNYTVIKSTNLATE